MKLINTLRVENELGEGVIWDHKAAKVWWTDIQQSHLYRYDPQSKELEQWRTPERLCCFAPLENGDGLVAAFESGFAFYNPATGQLDWIKKLEEDNPATRFNDGRTDRQGRLWSATMVEGDDAPYQGSLYCLHSDLSVSKSITDLSIPNSLCWSPNGETLYHTDTPEQQIYQYDFNSGSGAIGSKTSFVKTAHDCFPDGSIVDAQGYLWNAQWGGHKVVRYAPDGSIDITLDLPTAQPTCVAFGGKDLNLLIVTSAYQGMDTATRSRDTEAGNLFIYETQFQGLLERGFVRV